MLCKLKKICNYIRLMMKNRKINSIYFQIWLSEPQSPLLPGETITIYFSIIHSTKHLLHSHFRPISVLGAGDTAGISGTHSCPWVGSSELLPCHRSQNGGQGGISLSEMVQRVGEGARAQHRQSSWFGSFEGDILSCSIHDD